MTKADERIVEANRLATDRFDLWRRIAQAYSVARLTEVGVWRCDYAEYMLRACPDISEYRMIDPWRTLKDWNKPANEPQHIFEKVFGEAMQRTEFAGSKRIVHRDRTVEASDKIPNGSQDMIYVDGDHTLRGIAVDLIRMLPKVKPGGLLCGDDFTHTIWQHSDRYDPTFIFPFAVYFAEAHGLRIHALRFNQFVMQVTPDGSFGFEDLAGGYLGRSMRDIMKKPPVTLRQRMKRLVGRG